ncbi:DNA phosphorothioation-associated putative methyltransferase [Shewanella sp. 1_MG-2023]|uniref:DNA phosphorothioation-associated putative methyltransferase n=1 Tax=unclassified Shewanella TaxID=196818 RepID=UPI0026E1EEC4|nr:MULTISPECIES: DNA phosphorothioation-associated putative methyltransferase [unclassified Shewanella]MDO6610513.1 DNA phosphorothioation-associated putative methyltransferase [Shewanella sp. 7_MG-2023]MDO6770638.1 DNA phosphorothioation-associated putative methyltransferase [Shewanella sp. 2_MG-2023]MDO6795024.1 DNA phosphorothioation-associated putative methyltransferase [Shewanella sp. 1_MG-2023]
MDATLFKQLVSTMPIGKKLPDAHYIHKDALSELPSELSNFIYAVGNALNIEQDHWDLVKLNKNEFKLSLLSYPTFFTEAYPALTQSLTIDLVKLSHRITKYEESDNPPILHRKETMLPTRHEAYENFVHITQEGENAGLYANTRMIGFKQSWERIIAQHGYELVDGRLFRNSAVIKQSNTTATKIDRHKTAIVRHDLSAPMKQLAKQGCLNGEYTIFDYGCGRGDDLIELEAHGLAALGWDPNFRPEADKVKSDLVNIGFVINVIEDKIERDEALLGAWELTTKLLVVSAMLANDKFISQFTPYKDGIITSINTFQKYFAQAELKGYIERTLDENAIAIAPGIYYVFKDKIEEQRFLSSRFKRHHSWKQLTAPKPTSDEQARLVFSKHHELLNQFWDTCLALGRLPAKDEFNQTEQLCEYLGNPKKALKLILQVQGCEAQTEFEAAIAARKEDLLVYLALSQFEQHKSYKQLPEELKRDIKVFFDTNRVAQSESKILLYRIANTEDIEQACIAAHNSLPASKLNQGHSLELHKKFIPLLPALLRVYVGAAVQLYGELDEIDLVKIHITSGKVSFMGYDNFDTSPLPTLRERIKVKMWQLDVDFFDYIEEDKRPPLINKHLLLELTDVNYKKQLSFDKRLQKEDLFEAHSRPTNLSFITTALKIKELEIRGFRFYQL